MISTNRKPAVLPHGNSDIVIHTVLDAIIDRSYRLYIPHQKMTEAQKAQLMNQINSIKELGVSNAKEIAVAKEKVRVLRLYVPTFAEGVAIDRIQEELVRLEHILDIKISQDLISRGFWNPEITPERPDVNQFDYPIIEDTPTEDPTTPVVVPTEENDNNSGLIIGITSGIALIASALVYYFIKNRHSS